MLGQYPDRPYEGEPLNVIISNTSSPDVLKPEGFLIWATVSYTHLTLPTSDLV